MCVIVKTGCYIKSKNSLFIFWFKIITHLFKWRNYSSRYTVSAHEKMEFSQFLWLYIFPMHKPHTVIYLALHIIITAVSNTTKTDLSLMIKFQIFFTLFQSCDCEINSLFIIAESTLFSYASRVSLLFEVLGGYCSWTFLLYLFLRIAGINYRRFMAMRCGLICQRIFRTVGNR